MSSVAVFRVQSSWVAVILGGDCPRWQLSWMTVFQGGTFYNLLVFQIEVVLGGDCPRWQLSG